VSIPSEERHQSRSTLDLASFADFSEQTRSPLTAILLPLIVACFFFLSFVALVFFYPEKLIEPDAYAYRASIEVLKEGELSLNQNDYDSLSLRLQNSELGGGIMQWHRSDDGQWVSEKNPGYPFLAVPFDAVGARRLAPLFYGLLACVGMWFGGRRWLGEWGGTFAIGVYCSTPLAIVMAWRSTMPSFTDASLIALGLGLVIWTVFSIEKPATHRIVIGAFAFFSLSLATLVRYTNIVALIIAFVVVLVAACSTRWKLPRTALWWWIAAALPPLLAALAYNATVFDGPFSTGYNASTVQFSLRAIPENLRVMPKNLWQAMPVFVLGIVALVGLAITQLTARERGTVTEPSRQQDRWAGWLLGCTWTGLWLLYSAYEWTTTIAGTQQGVPRGLVPGPSMSGPQPVYSTVRFYLPALGAIALLVAWLFTRLPRAIGILALIALLVLGGREFTQTATSSWAGWLTENRPSTLPGPSRDPGIPPPDRRPPQAPENFVPGSVP